MTMTLRLPLRLRERLDNIAYKSRRSRTQELVVAVEAYLDRIEGQNASPVSGGAPAVGQEV